MEIVLGGYSYGALITSLLPSTRRILALFNPTPTTTTTATTFASEIRTLALHLAHQRNAEAAQAHRPQPTRDSTETSRALRHTIVAGGHEGDAAGGGSPKRTSIGSHHRLSVARRSLSRRRRSTSGARGAAAGASSVASAVGEVQLGAPIPVLLTRYLLISPLLPPVALVLTCFASWFQPRRRSAILSTHPPQTTSQANASASDEKPLRHVRQPPDDETNLIACGTLAIYGDADMFTSARKVRQWAADLTRRPGSAFEASEIEGAGHFWNEEGVADELGAVVRRWIKGLGEEDVC